MSHKAAEAFSELLVASIFDDDISVEASVVGKIRVEVDAFCAHLWKIAPKIMTDEEDIWKCFGRMYRV